jgi:5-methylcytosine-specific restriction protein A
MPTMPPTFRPFGVTPAQTRRAHDMRRGSASSRGYDRDWEKVRDAHLRMEPLCRFCEAEGIVTAGFAVDHIETIADRPDLRLDHANLRTLCESHHNARTAGDRPRGRGSPP